VLFAIRTYPLLHSVHAVVVEHIAQFAKHGRQELFEVIRAYPLLQRLQVVVVEQVAQLIKEHWMQV